MLYREKDVESALFHLVSYMIKYGKEHNRKGQPLTFLLPVPGSGCLLCFLYLAHSGPPPKKKQQTKHETVALAKAPFGTPRDLGKNLFNLANPASPHHTHPSAAPEADNRKPNGHGQIRDRKNHSAMLLGLKGSVCFQTFRGKYTLDSNPTPRKKIWASKFCNLFPNTQSPHLDPIQSQAHRGP